MTNIELKKFADELDIFAQMWSQYFPNADNPIDIVTQGIVELLKWDLSKQTHEGVISALESAIDGYMHAAMDYYVSTK